MKIDRILPTLKPDKDPANLDSYRPINNLTAIYKIIEEFIKKQINTFLEENWTILNDHHGSIKNHSTLTALSFLHNKLINNYHDGNISTIIQTDLSAAFDTVDHNILVNKLEHYGLRGKCLSIIKSFLKDRMQYVSIDTFNSKILSSLQCSVIQGSKLSALLYTLYVN